MSARDADTDPGAAVVDATGPGTVGAGCGLFEGV